MQSYNNQRNSVVKLSLLNTGSTLWNEAEEIKDAAGLSSLTVVSNQTEFVHGF